MQMKNTHNKEEIVIILNHWSSQESPENHSFSLKYLKHISVALLSGLLTFSSYWRESIILVLFGQVTLNQCVKTVNYAQGSYFRI